MSYVSIDLTPEAMRIVPQGKHRWFSLKSELVVPKAHVASVETGGHKAENGPTGMRFPGTNIPGRYLAGTFIRFWGEPSLRSTSFWVRRHPDKCIRIGFTGERYDYAMVEVDDPAAEIARIEAWRK